MPLRHHSRISFDLSFLTGYEFMYSTRDYVIRQSEDSARRHRNDETSMRGCKKKKRSRATVWNWLSTSGIIFYRTLIWFETTVVKSMRLRPDPADRLHF
jgi:hypothetical protein